MVRVRRLDSNIQDVVALIPYPHRMCNIQMLPFVQSPMLDVCAMYIVFVLPGIPMTINKKKINKLSGLLSRFWLTDGRDDFNPKV